MVVGASLHGIGQGCLVSLHGIGQGCLVSLHGIGQGCAHTGQWWLVLVCMALGRDVPTLASGGWC